MGDVGGNSGTREGSGSGSGTGGMVLPLEQDSQEQESDWEDMYDDDWEQVIQVAQGLPGGGNAVLRRQAQQQVAEERWVQRHLNWLIYEATPVRRLDRLYEAYNQWYEVLLQVSHSPFLTNDIVVGAMERVVQHFQVLLATVRRKPGWTPVWRNYCSMVKREVSLRVGYGLGTQVDDRQLGLHTRNEPRRMHLTWTYHHQGGDVAGLMGLPYEFMRIILIKSTYGDARNLWFIVEEVEQVVEGSRVQLKPSLRQVASEVCIPISAIAAYEGMPQVCRRWYAMHKDTFAQLGAVVYVLD